MSTWINRASLTLVLALAACVAPGGSGSPPKVAVLDGAVTLALPASYCFDPASVHEERGGAVAIGGRCRAEGPVPAAAITISLGAEGSSAALKPGARALTDWARSPAGRAALSRDGNPRSVRIRETLVSDGAFLIRLDDRAIGGYWRAALPLKGRLVMVSVTPPEGGPLSPEDGRRIAEGVVAALRRANAG
ncbi:MAG: hypothetical protein KBF78_16475 [Fuscovulum sp.]|jgi:hypothetical protein|nr:hypothetical protein [Fuscovulum sp.]